ncbi:MAG: DMT family transporter [Actinomycetota bacterium]
MFSRIRWQLALLSITVVWGGTFVIVQDAVERIPPFTYLALRFGLAVVVMAAAGGFTGLRRPDLVLGGLAGLALLAGYGFQTTGLQYTTPSNAGFITGMFLVFTPLFVAISHRRLPPASSLAGVAIATIGLFLLAAPGRLVLGYGDTLVLVCAAAFAAHILALDRWGEAMPTKRFASLQLTVVTIGAAAIALVAERGEPMSFDATVWGAIALTGVVASALAFFVQSRAQRELPPVRTAIILTSEPVFAGLFGYIDGDRLGLAGLAGAGLIFLGIVLAELIPMVRRAYSDPRTSPV